MSLIDIYNNKIPSDWDQISGDKYNNFIFWTRHVDSAIQNLSLKESYVFNYSQLKTSLDSISPKSAEVFYSFNTTLSSALSVAFTTWTSTWATIVSAASASGTPINITTIPQSIISQISELLNQTLLTFYYENYTEYSKPIKIIGESIYERFKSVAMENMVHG